MAALLDLPAIFRPSIVSASEVSQKYISSSSRGRDLPIRISFDEWGKGGIFDWYRELPNPAIDRLELRKEKDRFQHEFIVVRLGDGHVYRFDRRPVPGVQTDAISPNGCEAEDSVSPVNDIQYAMMNLTSSARIVLEFSDKKPDLYLIIATCVAIQMDAESKHYTLQKFNCYFLARTTVILIVRHHISQFPRLPRDVLRWDAITELAVSKHMFGETWTNLDAAIRDAVSSILQVDLWPLVEAEAKARLEYPKLWTGLEEKMKKAVREVVETKTKTLVVDSLKTAVYEWVIQYVQQTLWYPDLERTLLTNSLVYDQAAQSIVEGKIQPELEKELPNYVTKEIEDILPLPLINRLPGRLIANLPSQLLERIPPTLLDKLPDDFLAKLSTDISTVSPEEYFEEGSLELFERLPNHIMLRPPGKSQHIPDRVREIGHRRLCSVLNEPDHKDRLLALRLIVHLPEEEVPPEYRALRQEIMTEESTKPEYRALRQEIMTEESSTTETSKVSETVESAAHVPETVELRRPKSSIRQLWERASLLGLVVRITPNVILDNFPMVLLELTPAFMFKSIPGNAMGTLPPKLMARCSTKFLSKLPDEMLAKIPVTMFENMPRATLERTPTALLERFPIEAMKNIPHKFVENVSEDLADILRKPLAIKSFGGENLKPALRKNATNIIIGKLDESKDGLSDVGIHATVRLKVTRLRFSICDRILNKNMTAPSQT